MFSFATGTSSFEKIRKGTNKPIYLDKTDLIYQIFSSDSEVMLFTRPIRFMKSTNLNMIASFCDIQKRKENAVLFEGLSIRNFSQPGREAVWSNHFGRYPVIFLSFANITPGDSEHILIQFKDIIADLYKSHRYLLQSHELFDEDKKNIINIINKTADLETFQKSLKFLSECLNLYYSRPTIILIDEYDTPLHHAQIYDETRHSIYLQNDVSTHEASSFKTTLDFMLAFLKPGLKDNPNLHKGIMTGVLRTAFGSLVSTLNNVDVFSMLDQSNQYAPYFGVTEGDIEYLLTELKIEDDEERNLVRDKLRGAYNGYTIAGVVLFNPWSVMKYLSTYAHNRLSGLQTEPMSYWLATGNSSIIGLYLRKYFSEIAKDIETLLRLDPLNVTINERSTFADSGVGAIAVFWGMLLQCGYLTVISKQESVGTKSTYTLRIPNNEVYGAFINHLDNLLVPETLSQEANNRFTEALLRQDFDNFSAYLKEYLAQVVSYFDIQETRGAEAHLIARKKRSRGVQEKVEKTGDEFVILPEVIFHVLVMGVIAGLHQVQYLVHSNRESGEGRFDLLLLPCSEARPGIIFEFKKTDSVKALESAANKALQQIRSNHYETALEAYGVKHGIHIAIAFFGKNLCLKHERVVYQPTAAFHIRESIGDYFALHYNSAQNKSINQALLYSSVSSSLFKRSRQDPLDLLKRINQTILDWTKAGQNKKSSSSQGTALTSSYQGKMFPHKQKETFGLKRVAIVGDGNCFFSAILDQLNERHQSILGQIRQVTNADEVTHTTLRELAVGALIARTNQSDCPSEFIQNLNQLITDQQHDGTWAEDEIIRMMANVLNITIVLVNNEGNHPISVISEGNQGIIYLAYQSGIHFDSLRGNPSRKLLAEVNKQINRSAQSSQVSLETAWDNIMQTQQPAKLGKK